MNDKIKEITTLLVGFLMALMGFFAALNIKFEWLTEESINAFGIMIGAGALLAGGIYATYKNTFVITDKARKQKAELKRKGLK